jgi:hypothetical protein
MGHHISLNDEIDNILPFRRGIHKKVEKNSIC